MFQLITRSVGSVVSRRDCLIYSISGQSPSWGRLRARMCCMLAPPATHNHSAELVRNAHDEAAERIEQPPLPKRMRLHGCNRTGSRKVVLDPCLALSDQPSLGDLNQHFHICERERVKIV